MTLPPRRAATRAGFALGTLLAAVAVVGLVPTERTASAQQPAPLPAELQVVPTDAAIFVHADAAKLWGGPVAKALRDADPATFADLTAKTKAMFGAAPDDLRSVTAFWPKIKGPADPQAFGLALAFKGAYDAAKLKAGIEQLLPKGTKFTLHAPADRVALVLVGLDEAYAKPRPADKPGPLAAAVREAAAGTHLLVAATTLASLPDEIRGENLPREILAFRPLLTADAITAVVDLDRELAVEVRVKAATPPRAGEAEKALGALVELMRTGLAEGEMALGKGDPKDPGLKDALTILKAMQAALKGTKFSTEGDVARARASMSADLPVASAYLSAVAKVKEAAARAQSSNNLKQIALALHNYHDVHNAMPPAAVCDKTGKPLLSWRVLILPYVEQETLYKKFKLDEPWDSANNKPLLAQMPKIYANPLAPRTKADETHYRVFVGNGAAFDLLKGPKLTEFADGTSNTIMVATAADAVPWSKPDELAFDPDKDVSKLFGFLGGANVCMVAFADGSVRAISKAIAPKTLTHLITKSGGEVIDDPDF